MTHSNTIKGNLLWETWSAPYIFYNCLITYILYKTTLGLLTLEKVTKGGHFCTYFKVYNY